MTSSPASACECRALTRLPYKKAHRSGSGFKQFPGVCVVPLAGLNKRPKGSRFQNLAPIKHTHRTRPAHAAPDRRTTDARKATHTDEHAGPQTTRRSTHATPSSPCTSRYHVTLTNKSGRHRQAPVSRARRKLTRARAASPRAPRARQRRAQSAHGTRPASVPSSSPVAPPCVPARHARHARGVPQQN